MPPRRVVANIGELADTFARLLQDEVRSAVRERGVFTLAVPGGSVATQLFPRLVSASIAWERTHIFWADERGVPPDDPESNYAAAVRLWLEPAGIPAHRVHRMHGEEPDLDRAAREYGAVLARLAPRLDAVLLGVGPDGHVASLFPLHPALDDPGPVVAVTDAPKPPSRRITMTLPVLAAARLVVIAAFGAEKARAMREALDPGSPLPVARVLNGAERAVLLLDPSAAE